jgi:hypothetical protein
MISNHHQAPSIGSGIVVNVISKRNREVSQIAITLTPVRQLLGAG